MILVRKRDGNSAASPDSIVNDLIFITPDRSTYLTEIQGGVRVCICVELPSTRLDLTG